MKFQKKIFKFSLLQKSMKILKYENHENPQ